MPAQPSELGAAPPTLGAPLNALSNQPTLGDRDVLDDHALRKERLYGALTKGTGWRVGERTSLIWRILMGLVPAALIIVGIFVVHLINARGH